jgi:ankyrin repeat protein
MNSRIKNLILILLVSLIGITSFGQELTNETALNIKYGKIEKLKKFTSAELINACVGLADSKKYNYLVISIKLKSMKSLKYFIEKGANVERVCADKTPLMYAAKYGQLEMVKYLIEKGADPNASYRGNKTLNYAKQFNHPEIKKYLKEQKLH